MTKFNENDIDNSISDDRERLADGSSTNKSVAGKRFGEYTIQQLIGEGAFAEVYLARDKINRFVALKILKKQHSYDDTFVKMFHSEATTAAQLNHEHIIVIYSQGAEEGLFYMAMEYAPEGTLEDYLKHQGGKLSHSEICIFAKQIAEALEFAHSNNIIHRDIKPSNILLGLDNKIKLADFGIARAQKPDTQKASTAIQGTTDYMAPEQADPSAKVDKRTDVYAFGVVVYRMLSGRLPFDNVKSSDFVEQINLKRAGKLSELEGVPARVQAVIFKALKPKPEFRYRSAREFANDLIKAIEDWEASTANRQDKRDLIGSATLAMEQEDWQSAKEFWERAQKIGTSAIIENNLQEVNQRIKLQDEWTKVNESFANADWKSAIAALKRILRITPQDMVAPTKVAEAEKQIELNQLYEEGKTAFIQEDYALAVERFVTIYQQSPDYRDVATRLQEFKQTQIKDEFNRLKVEGLWALVENDLELARKNAEAIDNLGLGHAYGASAFLKRFNTLVDKTAIEQSEQSTILVNLKETLKVRNAHIEQQKLALTEGKEQLGKKQIEIEKLRTETNDMQREFTDHLYNYVSDLQNTLSLLEGNMITRYSAKDLIQTLRERIREIALRGQQLESKTIY